ncbi:MAG: hypothetical protein EHM81_03495 [Chloroflexi bacterium]|nr:MAG: hypothetical protein EHM81_03495 [Chloroflexota bacterium]
MLLKKPLLETEQLYFMHIPKCAGLSLIRLLDQHFTLAEICTLHDNFDKFINSYSPAERAAFRFIRGHFPYRLVDYLPRRPRTLTMLRHPVKRVISAIAQHRRMEEQGVSPFQESLQHFSIEEFMKHPFLGKAVSNVAIKYLIDFGDPDLLPGSLELAKERLERFDVVGTVEHFDDSLALLAHTYGWYPVHEVKEVNVDPGHLSKTELSQSLLDLICELNRDEIELYEFGVKLFKERLAQMKTEAPYTLAERGDPAQRIHYDFHHVNPGHGWHVGESDPTHGYTRWSAEPASFLQFYLQPNLAYVIRLRILKVLETDILRSLKLEANETAIPLKSKRDGEGAIILEGIIPAAAITAGMPVNLALKTNRVFPINHWNFKTRILSLLGKQVIRHEEDDRLVGLRYNWIDIYPLEPASASI